MGYSTLGYSTVILFLTITIMNDFHFGVFCHVSGLIYLHVKNVSLFTFGAHTDNVLVSMFSSTVCFVQLIPMNRSSYEME